MSIKYKEGYKTISLKNNLITKMHFNKFMLNQSTLLNRSWLEFF